MLPLYYQAIQTHNKGVIRSTLTQASPYSRMKKLKLYKVENKLNENTKVIKSLQQTNLKMKGKISLKVERIEQLES